MTTVDLRRCKFVEYQPDTVNICVWSPKLAGGRSPYVAVMRPKGGLELWQSGSFDGEKWRLLGRFSSNGLIGKSVEGLCWAIADDTKESENGVEAARRLRLFSVGLDGLVIEWDLVYLCPMRWVDTNGGGAGWCISVAPDQKSLAVGCENGSVRLLKILTSSRKPVLRHAEHHLDIQQGGRVISVAWNLEASVIATGSAQSVLSTFSVETGRATNVMRLDRQSQRDSKRGRITKEAIVWALAFAPDGSLLSCDSTGKVCVWSLATGTIKESFDLSAADLFAMATFSGAATSDVRLFVGGADQRLYELRKMVHSDKWFVAGTVRAHSHDIRSIGIGEVGGKACVLSGSIDTTMVAYSVDDIRVFSRIYSSLVGSKLIQMIPSKAIMVAALGRALRVWDFSQDSSLPPRQLLELRFADQIRHVAVSEDAQFMACALATGAVKLYRLVWNDAGALELVECDLPPLVEGGLNPIVGALLFDNDTQLIIIHRQSKGGLLPRLSILAIDSNGSAKVSRSLELPSTLGYVREAAHHRSGHLALLQPLSNTVSVLALGAGNVLGSPLNPDFPVDFIRFNPTSGLLMLVGQRQVFQYSIERRSLIDWPKAIKPLIGSTLESLRGPFIGLAFVPSADKFLLYGTDYILSVNLEDKEARGSPAATKRSRRASAGGSAATGEEVGTAQANLAPAAVKLSIGKYESIIFLDFARPGDALLVERPWPAISAAFPPVFRRKLFGGRQ